MPHRNGFARDPLSRPGALSAARIAAPRTRRDLRADQGEGGARRQLPRNPPSAADIDEQIRSFFERGLA